MAETTSSPRISKRPSPLVVEEPEDGTAGVLSTTTVNGASSILGAPPGAQAELTPAGFAGLSSLMLPFTPLSSLGFGGALTPMGARPVFSFDGLNPFSVTPTGGASLGLPPNVAGQLLMHTQAATELQNLSAQQHQRELRLQEQQRRSDKVKQQSLQRSVVYSTERSTAGSRVTPSGQSQGANGGDLNVGGISVPHVSSEKPEASAPLLLADSGVDALLTPVEPLQLSSRSVLAASHDYGSLSFPLRDSDDPALRSSACTEFYQAVSETYEQEIEENGAPSKSRKNLRESKRRKLQALGFKALADVLRVKKLRTERVELLRIAIDNLRSLRKENAALLRRVQQLGGITQSIDTRLAQAQVGQKRTREGHAALDIASEARLEARAKRQDISSLGAEERAEKARMLHEQRLKLLQAQFLQRAELQRRIQQSNASMATQRAQRLVSVDPQIRQDLVLSSIPQAQRELSTATPAAPVPIAHTSVQEKAATPDKQDQSQGAGMGSSSDKPLAAHRVISPTAQRRLLQLAGAASILSSPSGASPIDI
ncbi:MAG: hypothetical protein MHM6MM_001297 [Cercozoa sp. M6MM]